MVKGLYTAHMGMMNQQKKLDILSNNLANADTTAYKKEGTTARSFYDTLAFRIKDSSENNLPKQIGGITYGVTLGQTYDDFSQGSFQVTDNKYDIALKGNGFFGIAYTNKAGQTMEKLSRSGNFTVDQDGYIRTEDGDYLLNAAAARSGDTSEAGRVRIDPNQDFAIAADGTITQNGAQVAQIGVVDVDNYDYIERFGENLYTLLDGGNMTDSDAQMVQGALEMSNVNIVSEMVDMINVARTYESNQKIIQSIDETLDKAVNQVGRV
ncbi:MAG: flagellar hook-basal body protein [Lachnospiraceae bacterium]